MAHPLRTALLLALGLALLACASAQDRAWSYYTDGLEAAEAGRWDDSRRDYEASLATGYAAYGVHADYAVALARIGRYEEAEVQLAEEARLYPQSAALVAHVREFIRQAQAAGKGDAP